MSNYLNAIIICNPPDPLSGNGGLKYHKIINTPEKMQKFLTFAMKFPTAQYVNFYNCSTEKYSHRVYFKREVWKKIRPIVQRTLTAFE